MVYHQIKENELLNVCGNVSGTRNVLKIQILLNNKTVNNHSMKTYRRLPLARFYVSECNLLSEH